MSENNNSNTPWSTALENIAKFANLLKSYALKWYDMYFNPTPKDVEVDKIENDSDELTTVIVPNLAKIKQTFDTWKDTVQPQITALGEDVADLKDRESEVRAAAPYEILADTSGTPGASLSLSSYDELKIFSLNHNTGAMSTAGFSNSTEKTTFINDYNSGSSTLAVGGYEVGYVEKLNLGHERHVTNGLPSSFGKATLDVLTEDGNGKDNITEFVFSKDAFRATSTKSIVVSTPTSNYISTLVVAKHGVTGLCKAWMAPAGGLGSAKITITGTAIKI